MKKKAALLLAILALVVLMAACGQSGTSEPAPTAIPTATPTNDPVSSADEQLSEEESATTGTETHPEDQVNVSDDKVEAAHNQAVEGFITRYMEETGATREEAEAWWQNHQEETNAANEEAAQKREEQAAQREEEEKAFDEAMDQWYLEHTGMTADQFGSLSIQEKTEWIRQHPDVDFSTSPERTWDWQY